MVNRLTRLDPVLQMKTNRIGDQRARLFLRLPFRVAALERRTDGEISTVFVPFDDDGELVLGHSSKLSGARGVAQPHEVRTLQLRNDGDPSYFELEPAFRVAGRGRESQKDGRGVSETAENTPDDLETVGGKNSQP